MTSGNKHHLNIYLADEKVGQLTLDGASDMLSLEYTAQWQKTGFALSPHLPLNAPSPPIALQRFLRNLFPEGNGFERLLETYRISKNNTFGLIRILGSDTAGGLSFYPSDHTPEKQSNFRPIAEAELIERLNQRNHQDLIVWDEKPRLSVAGVQDKINVMLDENGNIGFGEGALCSTHILKFEQKQHTHLVLNEYITMRLCKQIALPVAEAELRRYGKYPALLVSRFDRKREGEQKVLRRYVIDGCQALNLPPEYKYERNFGSGRDVKHIREGASLSQLFSLYQHSQNPAVETKKLLDSILFNLCINNHDAHGKNFSYFLTRKGIQLAPAYDLVNIALYPEFDQDMAMALGDEFDSQTVNAYQLADFAESCKLPRRLIVNRLKTITQKLLAAIETTDFSSVVVNEEEKQFTDKLLKNVELRCQHLLEEAGGIVDINL